MMKVLIVDDEPWVLEGLKTMIDWGKHGFEVCGEALNGPDALRLIQEYKPELVLTDIHIPVINGLELIAQLHELMVTPPKFVILSGYDDFKYARTALRYRVNEYLLKPIDDDEIESLLGKLSLIIQEETASEQTLGKKQSFIRGNLINRLIQGEYNEGLELQARNVMKLQDEAELVCILICCVSRTLDLMQQVESAFPRELACFFEDSAGKIGIMLQSSSISHESLDDMVTQLRKDLVAQQEPKILVAVSERAIGVQSIRALYLQTQEIWKLKCHQEKSGVFFYYDQRKLKKDDDCHQDIFKQLLDKVEVNEQEQIESCVKRAFASFAEDLLTSEVVKTRVVNLELTICRLLAEMQGNPDLMMTKLHQEYGNLGDLNDYLTLSKYVCSLSRQAAIYLSQLKQQNEGNTIFNVIQYVDREFRTKLQLQDLAIHFHMNSTYLGQLFRKHTGQGFSEYLNEKRMEEAKSLLMRTQLKISDIANQVGYSKTDYFIDKFKLIVGVVPSVYRNINKNPKL